MQSFFYNKTIVNIVYIKFFLLIYTLFIELAFASAQIIPDTSLGKERSVVIPNQIINSTPSDLIQGGANRGSSKFHSFQEFNISSGRGAYFTNPTGIDAILARVTGSSRSNLFGKLGVLGKANLFILNPNGIVFGPNSSLDLNGSFLATTADYFKLQDGTIFSGSSAKPLLIIKDPQIIGLGFSEGTGSIEVQGPGHNFFSTGTPFLPPSTNGVLPTGLQVKPTKILSLIGGNVNFEGGVLTSPSGQIEIGSIISGELKLDSGLPLGISFSELENVKQGNIRLANLSLLNASGLGNSAINVFGENVTITDSSLALIDNYGANSGGDISVSAADTVSLVGDTQFTPQFPGFSRSLRGLLTQAFSTGKGADINISSKKLLVDFKSTVFTRSFSSATAGNIKINSGKSVEITGESSFDPLFPIGSIVGTTASANGRAGDILLSTQNLALKDGGQLSNTGYFNADGGDISIKAENISVTGFNPVGIIASAISSQSNGNGNGGSVGIQTGTLTVDKGGRITASTFAQGAAGNVTIQASDFVKVSGTIPGSINPSLIDSSANLLDPVTRIGLGLPPTPTGESGSVFIKTRNLEISDGADITVKNDGPGNAGQLKIVAKNITVTNGGRISGITKGGNGGNVVLFADILLLENGSISASAIKQGKGGNITTIADFVVALENSSITAEAEDAQGGNIFINALAVYFGPDVLVSVSSDAGLQSNGSVDIIVEEIDSEETTAPAPDITSTPKIASVCNPSGKISEFVVLGTGGLPEDTHSQSSKVWKWKVGSSDFATIPSKTESSPPFVVEATGWQKLEDGNYRLIVKPSKTSNSVAANPISCDHPSQNIQPQA